MLGEGVLGRAVARGVVTVGVHDLRDYTSDRHRTVDDVPYGGGPGMVLNAEPFVRACEGIRRHPGAPALVSLLSTPGRPFRPAAAVRFSQLGTTGPLRGRQDGLHHGAIPYKQQTPKARETLRREHLKHLKHLKHCMRRTNPYKQQTRKAPETLRREHLKHRKHVKHCMRRTKPYK